MTEADARRQYDQYAESYRALQSKVEADIRSHLEEHRLSVDIDGVSARMDLVAMRPQIKDFPSVYAKVANVATSDIRDIKDIAGVRVICHCRSDRQRAIELLLPFLEGSYRIVESTPEDTMDGYTGHHIVVSSTDVGAEYMCEIQIRTVTEHLWSVQSHKYNYKKKPEGDSQTLMLGMSQMLGATETFWELVKEKSHGKDVDAAAEQLSQDTARSVEVLKHTGVVRPPVTREEIVSKLRSFSDTDRFNLEDMVEREISHLKQTWETKIAAESPEASNAGEAVEQMQREMLNLTMIGLYAVRYDRKDGLKMVLDKFADVAALWMHAPSSRMVPWKSIPRAILHNPYYYFCIFALKEKKGDILSFLINYRTELRDGNQRRPTRIWSTAAFFAPDVLHGADSMFNRLRKSYEKDLLVKEIMGNLNDEEFLNLSCQVNMLFCMKMKQELDEGKPGAPHWVYPNYGRFYEERVIPLMQNAEWYDDYRKLLLTVFEMTDFEEFTKKANEWLNWSAKFERLGSGYTWDSVWGWKRPV